MVGKLPGFRLPSLPFLPPAAVVTICMITRDQYLQKDTAWFVQASEGDCDAHGGLTPSTRLTWILGAGVGEVELSAAAAVGAVVGVKVGTRVGEALGLVVGALVGA
jgi:hypothetical protein